jgi:hypothetical protein
LVLQGGAFCLKIARRPEGGGDDDFANVTVNLEWLCPYISARGLGVVIPIPLSTSNSLQFECTGARVKVDALVDQVVGVNTAGLTVVSGHFPPTNRLTIQWVEDGEAAAQGDGAARGGDGPEREGEGEAREGEAAGGAKTRAPASVVQASVFHVSETVVSGSTGFSFSLPGASRNMFEVVLLDRDTRVLSVEGSSIKRWEVGREAEGDRRRSLFVWLDFAVEDSYELTVKTEVPIMASSVVLPTFSCSDVQRELGSLCVATKSSVEVDVSRCDQGLSPIDISELPAKLRGSTDNIILAFRFVTPGSTCTLSVTRHQDLDVLLSVIDKAMFSAMLTEEGKMVCSLRLAVQNSSKQYLRVGLPADAEVWSLLINDEPTKPAQEEGSHGLLVPLPKGRQGETQTIFTVELTFVLKREPLLSRGDLSITFPSIDVPISKLGVTVNLPRNFWWSEFTGDLREVEYLTGMTIASPVANNVVGGMQQRGMHLEQLHNQSAELGEFIQADKNILQRAIGVKPVQLKMDLSTGGKSYYFSERVVIDRSLRVSVSYVRQKTKKIKRRQDSSCQVM